MSENTTTLDIEVHNESSPNRKENRRASILFHGPIETKSQSISAHQQLLVGRGDTVDICFIDKMISRYHALFSWKNNRLMVKDLGSRNGIQLSGKRVESAFLSSGDTVTIGNTKAIVVIDDEEQCCAPLRPANQIDTHEIVLVNAEMLRIYEKVKEIASINVSVLVLGETGSGKEHVAISLHKLSDRQDKPFRVINCGVMPNELVESVLFGHEKGSFTGASCQQAGVFEQANGGVLFLDEVGDLSASAQVALLRAIETKKICRIGSSKEIEVDVRIIAATNSDLESMVEKGTFRRDLLYRINTLTLNLPPLRKRIDEILPLTERFLSQACLELGKDIRTIHPTAVEHLQQYCWPGNIRQLRNVIECAVLECDTNELRSCHLPNFITNEPCPTNASIEEEFSEIERGKVAFKKQLRNWEINTISMAMRKTSGNQSAAARLLQMPLRTLVYKLKTYGLTGKEW